LLDEYKPEKAVLVDDNPEILEKTPECISKFRIGDGGYISLYSALDDILNYL